MATKEVSETTIKRLIGDASSEEEVLTILSGGEKPSYKDRVFFIGGKIFYTASKPTRRESHIAIDHSSPDVVEAFGLEKKTVFEKCAKLQAWISSYAVFNDGSKPSKSQIIEQAITLGSSEQERLLIIALSKDLW